MKPDSPEAVRARLEAKRAALAAERDRPLEPGEIAPPWLRRLKAGPVPVINLKRQRGVLDVLAAVVVVTAITLAGVISDAHARRGGCQEIARRYIEARNVGGIREARAARALAHESCYIEDAN